jgi:hypothetical protein
MDGSRQMQMFRTSHAEGGRGQDCRGGLQRAHPEVFHKQLSGLWEAS